MADAAAAPVVPATDTAAAMETPPAAAAAVETAAAPSFTFNGQTYTEAQIQAVVERAAFLDRDLQTVAQQRKAFESAKAGLKGNPAKLRAFLKEAGLGDSDLEDAIVEAIEDEKKTPEQRELEAYRAEKAERAARETEEKAKAEHNAWVRQIQEHEKAQSAHYISALEAHGLPRTPETVLEMAKLQEIALDAGFKATPDEVAQVYKARTVMAAKPLYEGLTAQQLHTLLPQSAIDAIIKHYQSSLAAVEKKAPDSRQARKAAKPAVKAGPRDLDDIMKDLGF